VFANFVSTLDGVVSFRLKGQSGGSSISRSDRADRFIMGLLRASADAVIVGATTVHEVGKESLWIPEYTYPEAKHLYADYRLQALHKREYPLVVVVSGSGKLELERAVFQNPDIPTVVITTPAGREEFTKAGGARLAWLEVRAIEPVGDRIIPQDMMRLLRSQFGVNRLLHEGGPTLFGQFIEADAIDELFLTTAPQIAGRAAITFRPALVQGIEFTPESAPWFELLSIKQKDAYLYLRYRCTKARQPIG
jgi:riboflavin biosynthesis pyrimidine reductase